MKKSYPLKNQKGAKLKTEKSKIRNKLQILLFMVSNKQSKKKPNWKRNKSKTGDKLKPNWKRNESEKKVVNYGKRKEA